MLGLLERNPERARSLGNGRRAQLSTAPARAIGTRDDERGPVGLARGHALEHRRGKLGGAEKDDAQSLEPACVALARTGRPGLGGADRGLRLVLGLRAVRPAVWLAARGSSPALGRLAHRPHGLLARLARYAVEDEDPVKVVHLVLDDPRGEPLGLDLSLLPGLLLRAHSYAGEALHLA